MERGILDTMDGAVWAKEFMRLFDKRRDEIDESLMIGWFCNSIMRGFDEATWRQQKKLDRAKVALGDLVMLHKLNGSDYEWRKAWDNAEQVLKEMA